MLDLENEQDHALIKLESRAYHMGSRDVFRYTNNFEDLVDLAGFDDPIVKVTKYRTRLDLAINLAITSSGGSARGTVCVVGYFTAGERVVVLSGVYCGLCHYFYCYGASRPSRFL
ncbi:hypothetical protein DFH06DRAFT_1333883 [Mycena polygramma]|nr:hypothetical protein DFH06DRAFT_1333883 [Mycena polygramma]